MIEIAQFGDVQRIRMWTRRTLAAGYDVSAYLVRGVLVDTGFRHVSGELLRAVRELKPRGAVVTHWHEDHAGNVADLERAGMPVWMAPGTEAVLRERPRLKLYRHVVWGRPRALVGARAAFEPRDLMIVETPGHSADHHAVFDPDTATLFSGDLWLGVKARVMGHDEDPYGIVASLERAIALRPKRMFDAHRGLVDNPLAALEAKRDWMLETIAAIERRLKAGDSERAVVRELLGGEELAAVVSQGEYSRRNFVRAVSRGASRGACGAD